MLAHRDALDSPGLAELSGTAALLELARIFRTQVPSGEEEPRAPGRPQLVGRDLRKTLVLVSTSGGSGGAAGARAWARAQDAGAIDGVLVLGRPRLGGVAQAVGRAVVERPRAAAARLAAHGRGRGAPGGRRAIPAASRASAQWARRALPLTVSEQGEVNRAGLPGGAAADQRRARARRGRARVARPLHRGRARRAARGHRARRGGPPARRRRDPRRRSPASRRAIVTLRNVLPGWSVRLMVLCLLLPALLAALDAFFRARRHQLPDRRVVRLGARRRRRGAARLGVAARARDHGRDPGAARSGAARGPRR